MLTEPLPTTLDVRKAAARGVSVQGQVGIEKLHRLQQALASQEGMISAQCAFSRDEQYRSIVAIKVHANLQVTCQRCLDTMPIEVNTENELAVVRDDEQARQLPGRLDPLLLGEEDCNLWSLVEDEVILGLPFVSYHETESCKQLLDEYTEPEVVEPEAEKENPFAILEQLKPGEGKQEL